MGKRKANRLSKDQRSELIRLFRKGDVSLTEAAGKFGITPAAASVYKKRANVDPADDEIQRLRIENAHLKELLQRRLLAIQTEMTAIAKMLR